MLHYQDIKPNISINAIQTYYLSEEVIFYPGANSLFGASLHHLFYLNNSDDRDEMMSTVQFLHTKYFTYREKKQRLSIFQKTINNIVQIIQKEHSVYRFL